MRKRMTRRTLCDECALEIPPHTKRKKCRSCSKMLCKCCTTVIQGDGSRCSECRTAAFLAYVAPFEKKTNDRHVKVLFQGHEVYGEPMPVYRMGDYMRRLDEC